MNLRERIREWLGISVLRSEAAYINNKLDGIDARLRKIDRQVSAITPGLGRIISKLDTQFARNPLSPDMKAESDVITEREIDRIKREDAAAKEALRVLEAEQAVRDQYGYTPKDSQ